MDRPVGATVSHSHKRVANVIGIPKLPRGMRHVRVRIALCTGAVTRSDAVTLPRQNR